jgi:hypothetical protein
LPLWQALVDDDKIVVVVNATADGNAYGGDV